MIKRCYLRPLRVVGADESRWRIPLDAVKETVKLVCQEKFARTC